MEAINRLMTLARKQIGVKESPPHSSNVPYNQAYYGGRVNNPKLHWCVTFLWWCFHQVGLGYLFYGGKKTASCSTLYGYHKGAQEVSVFDAKPGDLVFFDFTGKKKRTEHIGLCIEFDGDTIVTIDGNTGTTSEANGGCVMERRRNVKFVSHVIRPAYPKEKEDTTMEIITNFSDLPEWAKPAVKWAQEIGLIQGNEHGGLSIYRASLQPLVFQYRLHMMEVNGNV